MLIVPYFPQKRDIPMKFILIMLVMIRLLNADYEIVNNSSNIIIDKKKITKCPKFYNFKSIGKISRLENKNMNNKKMYSICQQEDIVIINIRELKTKAKN